MFAPVIHDARRDSRKATTSATSSGRPSRPSGNWVCRKVAKSPGCSCANRSQEPPGNMIEPGLTAFTRMLSAASSAAAVAASWISAALATAYVVRGAGRIPVIDEMITTAPPPAERRYGSPARMSSAACPAFSAKVAVKSPGAELARFPPTVPPALATRWSSPPRAAAISCTARFSAGVSVTSAAAVATGTPCRASRPAAAARPSALRATSPAAAPSAASVSATAKPMPRLPPVMSTRSPCRPRSMASTLPALADSAAGQVVTAGRGRSRAGPAARSAVPPRRPDATAGCRSAAPPPAPAR